jgi:hypothetical protein
MTDVLEQGRGKKRRGAPELRISSSYGVRLAASSLYDNSNSVIPIEADEGGVVRNLLLYQVVTKKMCIKISF